MHYLLVAGIIISSAVVVYTAYTLYSEGQHYYEYGYQSEGSKDGRFCNNDLPRGHRNTEDEVPLNNQEEKSNSLRRRKKKSTSSSSQRSVSSQVHSEDEEALLDRLSYLNAVEQEIERKRQQLAYEERILSEKEREIEQRKQVLLSSSHSSSSWHSLDSPIEDNFPNNKSLNSTSTTINSIKVDESLPLVQQQNLAPPNDLNSQPPIVAATVVANAENITTSSVKTMASSLHDEHSPDNDRHESDVFDMAAHAILAQDLSHISHSQKEASNNYPSVIMRPPARSTTSNSTISSSLKSQSMSMMRPPNVINTNQSRFVTTKSVRSEDTWSEIDSVISENVGSSILSSAVDIDMEDVDVIEH